MTGVDTAPVLPWRIPAAVIALLVVVIVLITLTGLGLVVVLAVGQNLAGVRGFDLAWPDNPVGQIAWMHSVLTIIAMFLVWLFAILVVAAHTAGSHRNAAVNAVEMVRVSIAIMLVRYTAAAVVPFIATGSWTAGLAVLASGAPLVLAQIALLLAADAYFCAVRENAPS